MRLIYLFLACSIFLFQNCTSNDDPIKSKNDFIKGLWNLQNVSGGIAGINEDFEEGNISWTFNIESETLNIEINNNFNYPGPQAGTYTFKIASPADAPILFIDGNEFGGIRLLENGFNIDQNIMSSGSGADGFIFKLLK